MEKKTANDVVTLARAQDRLTTLEYIEAIFEDFLEFHGDRYFADDLAVVGGVATLQGKPVTVVGIQKGRNLPENIERNFGSPNPEGYRKALRLMKQAEKFNRPVIICEHCWCLLWDWCRRAGRRGSHCAKPVRDV